MAPLCRTQRVLCCRTIILLKHGFSYPLNLTLKCSKVFQKTYIYVYKGCTSVTSDIKNAKQDQCVPEAVFQKTLTSIWRSSWRALQENSHTCCPHGTRERIQLPVFWHKDNLFWVHPYFTSFQNKTTQNSFSYVFKHSSLVLYTQPWSPKLEESKSSSDLQEVQEGRFRELQAGQLHLNPWEGDGENPPGKEFPSTWKTKILLEAVSMELQRGNHTWQASLPSTMRWLAW